MIRFSEDNEKIGKLFDVIHKFTEFVTFFITIMLALAVLVSAVGLFIYLQNENAISLYSKAISNIPMLTVLGFSSFCLMLVMVLYAIFPALMSISNGNSNYVTCAVGVRPKLRIKLKAKIVNYGRLATKSGGVNWRELCFGKGNRKDELLVRLFWIGFAFLIFYEPLLVAMSEGFNVWYGEGKLVVSWFVLLFDLVLFIASIVISQCSRGRFVVIATNYYGIFFMAMVLPVSFISPSEMAESVLFCGVALSMFCGGVLKLRHAKLIGPAFLETLLLYLPMVVIVLVLIKVGPLLEKSSMDSMLLLIIIVSISAFFIFISNCIIEYVMTSSTVMFDKVKNIISVTLVLAMVSIVFSTALVSNVLSLTKMGAYDTVDVHKKKVRVVIKVDGVEYFVDNYGKVLEVKY